MELGNPAALAALAALAVIFLLPRLRLPRVRVRVANTFLWRDALSEKEPRFSSRIRRNLLLILQAGTVAAIVFALAQPTLPIGGVTAAVVIDVSASMGAKDATGTRLDAAKRVLLERLDALPWRSRVHIVTAGHSATPLGEYTASARTLRETIERIQPMAGTSAIAAAVASARASAPDKILVVTDRPQPPSTGDVEWIAVGSPADNLAITTLAVRHAPSSPLDGDLLVEVENFGGPRSCYLIVQEDGADIYRMVYSFAARDSNKRTVVLRRENPRGVFTAQFSKGDALAVADALAADDIRYALARPAARVPVTLMTRDSFFLQRALGANPAVELHTVTPERRSPDGNVTVCDGCGDIPPGAGGVLMVGRPDPAASEVPLTIVDADHPVTSYLANAQVRVRPAAGLPIPADARVLATAAGAPVLATIERDGRRLLIAAIDLNAGTFPLEAAYPVLVAQAIEWLSDDGDATSVVAGEPARWKRRGTNDVTVTTPDGTVLRPRVAGDHAVFGDTGTPGVYTISDGRRFVVNAATRSESDLRQSVASPGRDAGAPSASGAPASAAASRLSIAGILLAIAALVLLAEWRTYCRTRVV